VLSEPFGMAHGVAFALAIAGLLLATWPSRTASAQPRSAALP
jgi:hypothetical protein